MERVMKEAWPQGKGTRDRNISQIEWTGLSVRLRRGCREGGASEDSQRPQRSELPPPQGLAWAYALASLPRRWLHKVGSQSVGFTAVSWVSS